MSNNIMHDICMRTNNELYIGVVGAVRSGKSTFIKKFMETKVLPYVKDDQTKNIITDELPQSSNGKTIMTVEPKFIPNNNVTILIDDETKLNVRLVDCVGYIIPGSNGYSTDAGPRLVKTPWFEDEIPFYDAAEIGTQKVIENHSNIGVLITSDGSISEFSREDYVDAEKKALAKLKSVGKPFVVIINTTQPDNSTTQQLREQLEEEYGATTLCVDVLNMTSSDVDRILKEALYEFNIDELNIKMPNFVAVLDDGNKIKSEFDEAIREATKDITKIKEVYNVSETLKGMDIFKDVSVSMINPGVGEAEITIEAHDDLYREVVSNIVGDSVNDRGQFVRLLQDYKYAKDEYDEIENGLKMVRHTGYGIAMPKVNDMTLDQPEVIKQGSRYGVKLKAIAPSIHMIKVDVESTFEPIIGTEDQSKQLIDNLMADSKDDPTKVWSSEIFGKSLNELVNDGIRAKLYMLPENVQFKFQNTLQRVINKGCTGIIAIVI